MVAKSPVWVRRRSSSASSVSDRPKRWEGVLENTLDQYESERANERAKEWEEWQAAFELLLLALFASSWCFPMPSCDNATVSNCPRFGRTYPSSVVRAARYSSHQHGSTSETQVPSKRASWNELGSKRRQRQGNAFNFQSLKRRIVVVVEATVLVHFFFSEYVTACISLDLSVFHSVCATMQGGFRWGSIPTGARFFP